MFAGDRVLDVAAERNLRRRGKSQSPVRAEEEERRGRAHVVVRDLAALGLVEADNLRVLVAPEAAARDVVDNEQEDVGDDGRVGNDRARRRELPPDLLVVVVDPARALRVPVKADHARVGKDSGQDGTDETADRVKRKTVNGVVDAEEDLESGGVVGGDRPEEADRERRGSADESGSGRDSDETSEDTRAERYGREFAGVDAAESRISFGHIRKRDHRIYDDSQVHEHPSKTAHRSRDVRDDRSLDRTQVHRRLRAAVEAEPDCAAIQSQY